MAHTILGFARGSLPRKVLLYKIYMLNMHNFMPFCILNLQKNTIFGGRKGHPLFYIRICMGNHKCTISVPFLSKFICIQFWWFQEGSARCLRKFCIWFICIILGSIFSLNSWGFRIFWWAKGCSSLGGALAYGSDGDVPPKYGSFGDRINKEQRGSFSKDVKAHLVRISC